MAHATPIIKITESQTRHYCDWCGEFISCGTSYYKWAWMEDGTCQTMKSHIPCYEFAMTQPGDIDGVHVIFDGSGDRE